MKDLNRELYWGGQPPPSSGTHSPVSGRFGESQIWEYAVWSQPIRLIRGRGHPDRTE